MNLTQYVTELQQAMAGAADTDDARAVAERLAGPLDSAARLMLLEALSAAAAEITRDLAPGSVDVRLRGRDPEFVVTLGRQEPPADDRGSDTAVLAADDGGSTRTTLRMSEHLKAHVDAAAARDGMSVNSWLLRAVARDLARGGDGPSRERGGQRYTGWVN